MFEKIVSCSKIKERIPSVMINISKSRRDFL